MTLTDSEVAAALARAERVLSGLFVHDSLHLALAKDTDALARDLMAARRALVSINALCPLADDLGACSDAAKNGLLLRIDDIARAALPPPESPDV